MRVLSIGTDRKLWEEDSDVRHRILQYGEAIGELHIVVFSLKSLGLEQLKLSDHVTIYPTNSRNRLFYVRDAIKIGRNIEAKFDVISTQDPFETGLVGSKLKGLLDAPLHMQLHTDFLSPHFKRSSFLNRTRVHLGSKIIKKADKVRVVSERIKKSLVSDLKVASSKIDILPIYIDVKKIKQAKPTFDLHQKYPQYKKIILMASRLSPEKDLHTALKVFEKVLSAKKDSGLVILGDGVELRSLRKKVRSLTIERSVKFEGWQDDVVSYMKGADLFLHTSLFEGYGLSLVQAYASGLPILSTDVGLINNELPMSEMVQICPVRDEKCLIRKAEEMLERGRGPEVSISRFDGSEDDYIKAYVTSLTKQND